MKITRFLLAFLLVLPFLQSCLGDITELDDPRDAITKLWRVTDNYDATGALAYDVTVKKHPTDKTKILFTNFGNFDAPEDLVATLAGASITISSQILDGTYAIVGIEGKSTVSTNGETITLEYSVDNGDVIKNVKANFANPNVKKKKAVAVAAN